MIAVLVTVVLGATVPVVTGIAALPAGGTVGPELLCALGLTVLGVLHTELATGVERIRRRVAHASYFDLSTVWTFAGALLLRPALAGLVVLAVYGHLWCRVWRPAGSALYRHVYTTATVVLAACGSDNSSSSVVTAPPSPVVTFFVA